MNRRMALVGAAMVVAGFAGMAGGGLGMREGRAALLTIVLSGALLAVLGGAVLRGARRASARDRSRRAGVGSARAEAATAGVTGDVGAGYGGRDHDSDTERSGSRWWSGGDSDGGWSGGGDSGGGGGDSGGC
ncbi:hypothetical protein ACGF7U_05125 [Micromonospora sp. NPDC047670]|uniref:hypothetical protein n=1 Tax=Micromonospora sp. NPDC047670 TaxID=3364252 RepID=UPI0037214EBA